MKNIRLMQRLLIIMGLVIIILGLGTCYGVMKERAARSEISDLQGELLDTKQRFVERIKNDSTKEYSQKQLITDKDIAIKLLGEEAKRYRNIKSVTKTVVVYDTDTIFAEYTDTVYKPIGREFCANEKYDTICGRVDSLGVVIYPHTTYLGDVTTTIANEKYGFLKLKSKPVVNVSFSNPNVRVVDMQNVVVKQPKPKRLAWLISGIAVGITGGILLMAN
jgi:uncharacterized lipoprotein YehR (DUF1307 family)